MSNELVNHPADKFRIVHEWQLHATGDCVAANVLSFLESWHKVKVKNREQAMKANAVAEGHGDNPTQDTSLLHSHSMAELLQGVMGTGGENKIRQGIKILENLGFVTVFKNPNKRYKFDNTKHFRLNVDVINEWLRNNWPPPSQLAVSDAPNGEIQSGELDGAVPNRAILYGSKEINQYPSSVPFLATTVANARDGSLPLTIPTVGKVLSGSPPKHSAPPPPNGNGKKLPTFFRPTIEEVAGCFRELCRLKHEQGKGCEPITAKEAEDWAEEFVEYYDNRDWKIGGKSKMKSWELTISDWIRRRIKSGWKQSSSSSVARPVNRSPSVWELKQVIENKKTEIVKIGEAWNGRNREDPQGFASAIKRRDQLKLEIENLTEKINVTATSNGN